MISKGFRSPSLPPPIARRNVARGGSDDDDDDDERGDRYVVATLNRRLARIRSHYLTYVTSMKHDPNASTSPLATANE